MKLFLEKLKQLTHDNNHTQARIEIASRYNYLDTHFEMYVAIKLISRHEGKTPRLLLDIRDTYDDDMFKKILHNHGRVVCSMIEGAL